MAAWLDTRRPASLAVIGSGSMGLELTGQLHQRGLQVTLIEPGPHLLPTFDADMADHVAYALHSHGVEVRLGVRVAAIEGGGAVTSVLLTDGESVPAEMVILNVGLLPNVELAEQIGVAFGPQRCHRGRRNDADEHAGRVRRRGRRREPLPAVRPALVVAPRIDGQPDGSGCRRRAHERRIQPRGGVLGTAVFSVLNLTVGITGLTERDARDLGLDVVVAHVEDVDRAIFAGVGA